MGSNPTSSTKRQLFEFQMIASFFMLTPSLFLYNFCTTTRLNRRPSRFACREYSRKHKSSTFYHIATHFSNKRLYILTFLCNLAIYIRYRLKRTREKRKNKQISTHAIHRVLLIQYTKFNSYNTPSFNSPQHTEF